MATEVKHPIETATGRPADRHVDRTELFWTKYSRLIIGVLAVIVLGVAAFFAYNSFVKAPNTKKAAEAMWKAEEYFRMDSARLALNGDGANQGFLRIISRYGGTPSGKLAKFYAGASYMKLGDFNNAIRYLKDFSTDDKLLQVRTAGLLGDAYAETGKKNEAVEQYRKAGTHYPDDNYNSPEYLFRAGLLYQELGKNGEAIEMFKIIRDKYHASQHGRDIEKYLARLGEYN